MFFTCVLFIGNFDDGDIRIEIFKLFQCALKFEEEFDSTEESTSVSLMTGEVSLTDVIAGELIEILTGNAYIW